MKALKGIMRGIVSFITLWGIGTGLVLWIGADTIPGNFGGTLLWVTGLLIVSSIVWVLLVGFIIWLTDGKWELDEEESEEGDASE